MARGAASTYDDEGEQAVALRRLEAGHGRALEALEHPVADALRVPDVLEEVHLAPLRLDDAGRAW